MKWGEGGLLTRGRARRLMLTMLVAAGAMGIAAAPASAVRTKTRSASDSVSGQYAVASATATCPSGYHAFGGGFRTSVPDLVPPGQHWLNIHESRRVGKRKWRVSGSEYFPGGSDTLTTFVNCQRPFRRVRIKGAIVRQKITIRTRTATIAIPTSADQLTQATTNCRPRKPLSGGFSMNPAAPTGSATVWLFGRQVRRTVSGFVNAWRAAPVRLGGVDSRQLTVYSYCAKQIRQPSEEGNLAFINETTGPLTVRTGKCNFNRTQQAYAGGWEADEESFSGVPVDFPRVYESRRSRKRWVVSAAPTPSTSEGLVALGYCR